MRIIDVDAHLHEPLDWLEQVNPKLSDELGPPARFMDVAGTVFSFRDPAFELLPEAQRPAAEFDTVPPGFIRHLELTDTLQPEAQVGSGDNPFCGPEARLRFCDERGIDVQFLNPTFLVGPFVQAARAGRHDLFSHVRESWNRWASAQVAGHTDRLIPVTQIDMSDIPWSIEQMTRMRAAGSRAFAIPEAPVRGLPRWRQTEGRSIGKSITHPDFEPLWSAAEDLGMAAFAHVGFARERINVGWANNGADDLTTFSMLNMLVASQSGPQLLLGAMVYDGLLERHPNLTVVVEEVGIDWLPHLLWAMDQSIGKNVPEVRDAHSRPHFAGDSYTLPLAPSEYIRRQVRVTPLVASQPLHPTIDAIPPEILCFSSDYPHVEGTDSPVEICERQLASLDDKARSDFFGGVGELLDV